jgi:glycosyltransferase involved in cell wall biosynthesis
VLFVAETGNASTWYRAYVPGEELRERGYTFSLSKDPTPADVAAHDVFAARVAVGFTTVRAMDHARSLGKLCVLDVDDDVWSLHPDNPAYEFYEKSGAGEHAREVVRFADVVTVPTRYLADLIRPMNPNVVVIPNALPQNHWPSSPKDVGHGGEVVIGWAGSSSHSSDIGILSGVVESTLSACPTAVFEFSDTLELPFSPDDRIRRVPSVGIEEYAGLLGRFDIGLAPLKDTRFNRAKSDLKALEYAMCGVPTVASKVLPYTISVRHGETGMIAASPKDWIKYVRRLVDDAESRARMGAAAHVWAQTRTIARLADSWARAYGLAPLG